MRISFEPNPVLVKELRGRMRGPRAYIFLTGMLGLLALVSYGLYRIARYAAQSMGGGPPGAVIGQVLFSGLVFLVLGIICAVAPGLTAGAVSGEHEHKTIEMLVATPLRPASILFGKLLASLSYISLLVAAAIPLVSLSYVYGGVSIVDMLQSLLLLLGFALTFSVVGIFFSALFRRTGLALGASYVFVAGCIFGTLLVYIVIGVMRQRQPPVWLLALNPFSAIASALGNVSGPNAGAMSGIMGPLWLLGGGSFDSRDPTYLPLWRYTVGVYAWLCVTLYGASAILVRPLRRFKLGKRGWAAASAFLILSLLAAPVIYGPLTPARLAAWVRWAASARQEMVANGRFTGNLEPAWSVVNPGNSQVRTLSGESLGGVQITHEGDQPAETRLEQEINRDVPKGGWLQLRTMLRVDSHSMLMCGSDGGQCPIKIELVFEDAQGKLHKWVQGFYADGNPAMSSTPPFCVGCEISVPHIQVPRGGWYTFDTGNLAQTLSDRSTAARRIKSVAIVASGTAYQVVVTGVSLWTRQGRPLDWGQGSGTPTPVPVMPVPAMRAPVMIAPVMPTPVPMAIPEMDETPQPTPTPVPDTPAPIPSPVH